MAKFRTAADLMHSPIEWATPVTTLGQAARIMKDNWFSQLPVRDGEKSVGRVTEDMLCRELKARSRDTVHHMLVEDLPKQGKPFREVAPETPIHDVIQLLEDQQAILVTVGPFRRDHGIITRADLLRYLLGER